MNAKYDLKGQTAIVTGGGKGIGRAIALGLAESGAAVVVAGRTLEPLEAVAAEIRAKGSKAMVVQTDLVDSAQVEALAAKTVEAFGRIDILVNNAARSFLRSLMDLREDGWDKVFDTNVKAVWLLSRAVARTMMARKSGTIINITTVGAEKAELGMAAYGCSKAALKMLTRCMAREWAPFGIRVNAVGPGLTRTDFSKPLWSNPEMEKHIGAALPLGRIAEPEEMAPAVLFLASEGARYMTGHTIYVDGGALTM
ncbi:MAG: SDR family NAD(P)-dependent oxidoreductase [Desulfobacteraceae bacterium]|nr:SDR family NAD(P)-dependent oxidoreductase [Desulfobacteraceae bacterium]